MHDGTSADEGIAKGSGAWEGPLDTAIMFVDLVDSSVFASVLGLKEYADYVESFHEVVRVQCDHFFEHCLKGKYEKGPDYEYYVMGDQLVFFMHTEKPSNDVYLLTTLGITLKAAWVASPFNRPIGDVNFRYSGNINYSPDALIQIIPLIDLRFSI